MPLYDEKRLMTVTNMHDLPQSVPGPGDDTQEAPMLSDRLTDFACQALLNFNHHLLPNFVSDRDTNFVDDR